MTFPTAVPMMNRHGCSDNYWCYRAGARSHLHSPVHPLPPPLRPTLDETAAFFCGFEYVDFYVCWTNRRNLTMMIQFHGMDSGANESLPWLLCCKNEKRQRLNRTVVFFPTENRWFSAREWNEFSARKWNLNEFVRFEYRTRESSLKSLDE
jgi:hypothetical protein